MASRALLALALLVALAPAATTAAQESYGIRPGDRLTTQLFTAAGEEVEVVGGERIVDRNGEVFLPFVGSLRVQGLDETGLRALLAAEYASFYADPVVDVEVELRINVTGAVSDPGLYFLDPTATIPDAVATAGGVTPEFAVIGAQIPSDPSRVQLIRDGQVRIVNLQPSAADPETLNLRIQSGDWINVPFQERSSLRTEIQFWGSVVSLVASTAGLVYLLTR